MSTMSHRNHVTHLEQEMLDDSIEYATRNDVSSAQTKYASRVKRAHHLLATISLARSCSGSSSQTTKCCPASPQARRLNYGRGGRILMLLCANKTRWTNENTGHEKKPHTLLYFPREEHENFEYHCCTEASDEDHLYGILSASVIRQKIFLKNYIHKYKSGINITANLRKCMNKRNNK